MKWTKRGLIYAPSGDWWWARSHAYVPTAEVIEDEGIIRVYFASWDENQIGRIGYVDLDIDDPKRILYLAKEPVLDIGELGTFDDSGVGPSCVVNVGDEKHLYYFGFQRAEKMIHLVFAGLAISDDGGKTFDRFSRVPILDRTSDEPFLRSSVSVIVEDGLYRMWYTSGLKWFDLGVNPLFSKTRYPSYVIRYTESADGIRWSGKSRVCIDFKTDDEFGLGRPWVVKDDDGVYRMWYSIRSKIRPYRIGYAESKDGLNWIRKDDEVGIEASETGWDSEMICFPCVVDVRGRRCMFYNGNRHGESGFGYAELEREN